MTEQVSTERTSIGPLVDEADLARDLADAKIRLQQDLQPHLQRLTDDQGRRLVGSGTTFHRLADLTRTLTTAGLSVHDCAVDTSIGGVCLVPNARDGTVTVSWATHRVMPRDPTMATAYWDTYEAMTDALMLVLATGGWNVRRRPDDEGLLVTDGVHIDDRGDEAV